MNTVFLGPPGAGKGTHAQRMCKLFNIPQISTGDILRQAIKDGSKVGLEAKSYMDAGKLVPDELVIAIAKERLAQDDCKEGYILDGFPRTLAQAEALDKIADIHIVINIDVADEVIVNRLGGRRVCPNCKAVHHVEFLNGSDKCNQCGSKLIQRKDDNETTIRSRLAVYAEQTAPLVAYYENSDKIVTVDGSKGIDEVTEAVRKKLEALND